MRRVGRRRPFLVGEARQAIKAKVAKVRGMLENATYDDKRFLLDMLDVQVQLCRREDGRWLYVTCGIVAETGMLKLDEKGASRCEVQGQRPEFSFLMRSC